ncbi:conserved hypothetical protein [Candidatus Sulfopaludibacter sp. SbA6]|nr:conserved hypothetical protein [Candidatus Sulfopaludibacter sp. SbA6]
MEEKTAAAEPAPHAGCFFCTTAMPLMERVWNEATRDHFRNSRIEFLKGLRSLIDDRIAHLSRHEEPKGKHVTVE